MHASPELQICVGDRIDAYRVDKGPEGELVTGNELSSEPRPHALILKISKPSLHSVTAMSPCGIRINKRVCNNGFFVVSSIMPSGSIQKWNEEHPDKCVSIGDVILGVDGVKGTASEVQNMLKGAGCQEMELMILHYPPQ